MVSGAFYGVNPQEGGQSFTDGPLKDPTTPTTSPSPTDQLDRKWATALRQVRAAFGEQRVRPSQGTLECAAGIEMELDRGWPDK